jgi:hypothetical protein
MIVGSAVLTLLGWLALSLVMHPALTNASKSVPSIVLLFGFI